MKSAALLALVMTASASATDYAPVIPAFETAVRAEMDAWQLGGVAVAWVDGTQMVYESAFGEATKDSVFRAGSVSKLFNAVAVMQMVEAGRLDLDAAIDPKLLPENPFPGARPVTPREILCHRSGLQREATVGGYFDASEPGLVATVASLPGGALATPPNAMTRYSNIAPSLAGLLVAGAAGRSFENWQAEHVLAPLGMKNSAWSRRDIPDGRIITSHMRVADGLGGFQRRETPLFDLGTVPAGNLYTTAADLARFMAMWAADGEGVGGRVLKAGTIAEMWKPQLDAKGLFGLGFALGDWRGRKTVGHSGAVFGHSTAVTFLPQENLGVVVLCNEDIVNGRLQHLANLALSLMIEGKLGEKPPAPPSAAAWNVTELSALAGAWESQSFWLELVVEQECLRGNFATQPCVLTPVDHDHLVLRSRIHDDVPVSPERDEAGHVMALTAGVQRFTRVPSAPPALPEAWRGFLGSYGPGFIPLVVHEKFGHLYATTENMVDYRLMPVNRLVFGLPPGMYAEEEAVFLTGPDGPVWAVNFANMILPRARTRR